MDQSQLADKNPMAQGLGEKLMLLETPFTWMPVRSEFSAVNSEYVIQENIPKEHDNIFLKYVKYMCVIYEMGLRGCGNEVLKKVDQWKRVLERNEVFEEPLFKKSYAVLKHVLYSSEAYLFFKHKDYSLAEYLLEQIEEINLGEDTLEAAAINGLKAEFFDNYGSKGHEKALGYAQKAMELDPTEHNWIFMTAKTMRDIRRSDLYNMEGTEESRKKELKLFEKLISIKKKPIYLIRFGNSHHDYANYLIYKLKENNGNCRQGNKHGYYHQCPQCKEIKELVHKGVQYLKEALAIQVPRRDTYLLVIRGINNIAKPYNYDYENIMETWVEKILDSNFNNENDKEVFYAVGKYYQKFGKNPEDSKEYFKIAADLGSLNAKKDLISIKFKENQDYNPQEDILEIMNAYPDKPKKLEYLCQLASYYLFIKRDLLKALTFIQQEKEEDPKLNSLYLRKHKSWFLLCQNHKDLLREIVGQISLKLRRLFNSGHANTNEYNTMADFKLDVQRVVPNLFA